MVMPIEQGFKDEVHEIIDDLGDVIHSDFTHDMADKAMIQPSFEKGQIAVEIATKTVLSAIIEAVAQSESPAAAIGLVNQLHELVNQPEMWEKVEWEK